MSDEDEMERLTKILISMGVRKADINTDASFRDMGINSVDLIDMVFKVEDAFSVTFPEEHLSMKSMHSPRTLLETIHKIRGGKK